MGIEPRQFLVTNLTVTLNLDIDLEHFTCTKTLTLNMYIEPSNLTFTCLVWWILWVTNWFIACLECCDKFIPISETIQKDNVRIKKQPIIGWLLEHIEKSMHTKSASFYQKDTAKCSVCLCILATYKLPFMQNLVQCCFV